jgi:uncharacterized membrane protein HdeD (DUF308 family)
MLLIGARALRRKWPVLTFFGLLWMALGLAIMADASDGVTIVATEGFAIILLFEGFGALAFFTLAPRRRGYSVLIKACALLILGCMILDFPVECDIENSLLFGIAFLIDGCARIATAFVVHFPKWQVIAAGGVLEIGLASIALSNWPVSHHQIVPFCIGIALLLSGWTVSRLGLTARRLTENMLLLSLPIFQWRGWYSDRATLPITQSSRQLHHATPLLLHVWTPVGSAENPERRLLIDRYVAAVDGRGMISTGHSALELPPDLYISHYPLVETDHAPDAFVHSLRATADNDVPGKFQPSYAFESADWCPADAQVEFHTYDADRLRAHWIAYSRDSTYNLTNRNCSVTVAVALEAALEGTLDDGTAWRRFFLLIGNPDLWIAALLRARAESMTWTPGLVLDYARSLQAVVQPRRSPWLRRLQASWRRHRSTMAKHPT